MTKAFDLRIWKDGAATYGGRGDVGEGEFRGRSKSLVSDIWDRQLKTSLEFRQKVQAKAVDLGVIGNRRYLKIMD